MVLEHNSSKLLYRSPHGACKTEEKVTLRLCVESFSIPDKVVCIIGENQIDMHYLFDINSNRIYECSVKLPSSGCLLFYYFFCECDGEKMYYGNNTLFLGGMGEMSREIPKSRFQITVYDKTFTTPAWAKNAIIYQIFPDRFYRCGETPFHGIKRNWDEEPFYKAEQFGGKYLSNDFFGGTFSGILEKLDYLCELGINAIYLNPIFKAFSNHRYDTSSYEETDETLGTKADFIRLCDAAEKKGVKIILDGVFSHTGADSVYFNKFNTFPSKGAFQSKESPYYSWYTFSDYPEKYDCWWGFDTLPNVNELDKNYLDYIIENDNSIIKRWLRRGACGWRLDVCDELPDEFLEKLRKAVKKEKEDALIIGEVWEDASHKESYGKLRPYLLGESLDSVMNYVFREAVLDFLTSENACLFAMRIDSLYENYPKESLYCAMNLISSHDVPRAITVLSGAPDFRGVDRIAQHDYKISEDALSLAKKRMMLAITIQMTMPGAPSIYYGDEIGLYGYSDPFNRAPYPWGSGDKELFEHTKKLVCLRKGENCLRTGDYTMLYYTSGIVCYMRSIEHGTDIFGNKCTDGSIIVIINSSKGESNLELDLERFSPSSLTDVFTSEKYLYNGKITLSLAPVSARVLRLERNGGKCTKIQSM